GEIVRMAMQRILLFEPADVPHDHPVVLEQLRGPRTRIRRWKRSGLNEQYKARDHPTHAELPSSSWSTSPLPTVDSDDEIDVVEWRAELLRVAIPGRVPEFQQLVHRAIFLDRQGSVECVRAFEDVELRIADRQLLHARGSREGTRQLTILRHFFSGDWTTTYDHVGRFGTGVLR